MIPNNIILNGLSEEQLKQFPDNHFDSCVTDPNYGLSFMGMHWDYDVPTVELWKEVYRVLKPGAHLLSFGGTRTYHRLVIRIEDAGFEIRDQLQWIYGSGFPKSLNVEKNGAGVDWEGWGTGLKPANEPICLARKPLSEKTIAKNVLKHGTGAININDCKIPFESIEDLESATWGRGTDIMGGNYVGAEHSSGKTQIKADPKGRWPSNIILDEEAAVLLDQQTGNLKSGAMTKPYTYTNNGYSFGKPSGETKAIHEANEGGASRFFYCAKASRSERNKGLEGFENTVINSNYRPNDDGNKGIQSRLHGATYKGKNYHPTVKPISLIRYLVRLITPSGGICLDPFGGSGTGAIACGLEGVNYVLIDQSKDYVAIGNARVESWKQEFKQLELF